MLSVILDMTNLVEDQGAVQVRVPGDDGGGDVEVHEGAEYIDSDSAAQIKVPVGEGGSARQ